MAWHPMATAPRDGTEILIRTNIGAVSAWYKKGEWNNHLEGREYDGPVWVCYDDEFQIFIEEVGAEEHSEALGWMPLEAVP